MKCFSKQKQAENFVQVTRGLMTAKSEIERQINDSSPINDSFLKLDCEMFITNAVLFAKKAHI